MLSVGTLIYAGMMIPLPYRGEVSLWIPFVRSRFLKRSHCDPQVPNNILRVFLYLKRSLPFGSIQWCFPDRNKPRPPWSYIFEHRACICTCEYIYYWSACAPGYRIHSRRTNVRTCYSRSVLLNPFTRHPIASPRFHLQDISCLCSRREYGPLSKVFPVRPHFQDTEHCRSSNDLR